MNMKNRLHRLYRSVAISGIIFASSLVFVIPATREWLAGNPVLMLGMLMAMAVSATALLACLVVADRVADETNTPELAI